ncbi:MAG: L,D-transpeptidase [Patescibacteria group bacterium]
MAFKRITSTFLILIPIIILVAIGIITTTAKKVASAPACGTDSYSGIFDPSLTEATYEDKKIAVPTIASIKDSLKVLGEAEDSNKWIEVSLKEQKLRAWDGNSLFLETLVSTGLPWTPTPMGEFNIWIKLRSTKMEGGKGKYYYYLPNVPYVMYFEGSGIPGWKGYGLHGTYWHNSFGTQRSHGCVNLPTPIAERLFGWAPVKTRIVIHD